MTMGLTNRAGGVVAVIWLMAVAFSDLPAQAPDPCDAVAAGRILQGDRQHLIQTACDREQILIRYLALMKEMLTSARLAAETPEIQSAAPNWNELLGAAKTAVTLLEPLAPNDDGVIEATRRVEATAQLLRAQVPSEVSESVDSATAMALCQSELSWRRSKLWKAELDRCPIDSIDETAPAGETVDPVETVDPPKDNRAEAPP